MVNEKRQDIIIAPIGFSWPTLFFSFLIPLSRKDFHYAYVLLFFTIFFPIVSNIIFAFVYNERYISSLIQKGYTLHHIETQTYEETLEYIRKIYVKTYGDNIDANYINIIKIINQT